MRREDEFKRGKICTSHDAKLFSPQWHGHKYNSSLSENQRSIATFILIENEFIEFLTVSILFTIFAALTLS